jgi:uncharacterized protein YabN with tetrapyrrole methylase and pyrophosphatase domain
MVAERASGALRDCLREELGTSQTCEDLGHILLALVDLAREIDLDPESALREASLAFAGRFRVLEAAARRRESSIDEMDPEEIRRLWRGA